MTKNEFFNHLQSLSVDQLEIVHQKIIDKISQRKEALLQESLLREASLKAKNARQKQQKTEHQKGYTLPKIPANNVNINDMADNLDIDISSLMREISKR